MPARRSTERFNASPLQTFHATADSPTNVLRGKPAETSSTYNKGGLFAPSHLTDCSDASHVFTDYDPDQRLAIHGFNSPLSVIRIWRAEDRVAQQMSIKSSLADLVSLQATDYETTLATYSTVAFNDEGYVDVPVKAPPGTKSLFLRFGNRTEYYPNGSWDHVAGIRIQEIQAFASTAPVIETKAPTSWTRGRFADSTSLRFNGVDTQVQIRLPQRLEAMTLAAWLTVEFLDDRRTSCGVLTSAAWGQHGSSTESVRLHLGRGGEVFFDAGGCKFVTPSVLPWQTWDRNRWRHLAVVIDPSQAKAFCYLDGRQVLSEKLSGHFAATVGVASLGGLQHTDGQTDGGFRGRMSELTILSRAMADGEIAELYELGRP